MCPVMKLAVGIIDGTNLEFATPTDYKTGSVRVFTSHLQWAYFPVENGGNSITLSEAPIEGDLVYVYYISLV